jgi:hypothetical protein
MAAFFARAAGAVARDPAVVGWVIANYQARCAMTEERLAAWLGLAGVTALHQLALCTRPLPSTPSFDADVVALARYFDGDAAHFRELLLIGGEH